jgi:hypothetical protein
MESILTSIKKLLGIEAEYEHFDEEIIPCINSALMILTQLGVGPSEGFTIVDETSVWTDFVPDTTKVEALKTYVHLRVKLVFDPPLSSTVVETIKETLRELEWRLHVASEATVDN